MDGDLLALHGLGASAGSQDLLLKTHLRLLLSGVSPRLDRSVCAAAAGILMRTVPGGGAVG